MRIDKYRFHQMTSVQRPDEPAIGSAYFLVVEPYDEKSRHMFYGEYEQWNGYSIDAKSEQDLDAIRAVYRDCPETIYLRKIYPDHWNMVYWSGYATWIPQEWEHLIEDDYWPLYEESPKRLRKLFCRVTNFVWKKALHNGK